MAKVSLKKNFAMNALLSLSSIIFPIITFPYVSRVLKAIGNGKVQTATSIVTYFMMFAQLGIPTYGVKACAQVKDDRVKLTKTAHELLIINLVTSLISYIVLFTCMLFMPSLWAERYLYLVICPHILLNAVGTEWLYKALEKYSYITIRSIIFKFIAFVSMFILIHKKSDYVIYGGITIFATSASAILNFINARKYIDMKLMKGYDFKRHLRAVGVFFAMSCATTVYLHLDTLMIKYMAENYDAGDTEVGFYNAAVKVKTIIVSLVTSLGAVMLPRASYYIKQGKLDDFKRITRKALWFVTIVATPLFVYFTIFSHEAIMFLSGEEYYPSIPCMMIIMPTVLFIGLTNIMGIQILVPLGKEKIVLYSVVTGAVVDLILNLIFIPIYKSSGAALGTVVAEFAVLVYQYSYLRKHKEIIDIKAAFGDIRIHRMLMGICAASLLSFWVKFIDIPISSDSDLLRMLKNLIYLAVSAILFFLCYGISMILMKDKMAIEIKDTVFSKLMRKKKV